MTTGPRVKQRRTVNRFVAFATAVLILGTILPAAATAQGADELSNASGGAKTTRGGEAAVSEVRSLENRSGLPTQLSPESMARLRKSGNPKLDSTLSDLVSRLNSRAGGSEEALAADAPISRGSTVLVAIRTTGAVDSIAAWVTAHGGLVANTGEALIEAYVPVSALTALTAVDGVGVVNSIAPPRAMYGPTNSEGVGVHNAGNWQANGYTGAGVKVGVIDVGFEGYGNLMGSEVPNTVVARCYSFPGNPTDDLANCQTETVHGTAVAEAVMDIAPGVEMYIANPHTHLDLRETVDWMVSHGVQIINHSVGWHWSGPGDGTSRYADSPNASVNNAVAGGILWANAAGNEGYSTWTGQYGDSDGDKWLDFAPNDETNYVGFQALPAGSSITILVRWGDSWGGADTDIDIGLYDSLGTLVASSDTVQAGGQFDDPYERIQYTTSFTDDYYVAMYHVGGPTPTYIEVQEFEGSGLEHYSDSYSIGEPGDSSNPGMLTVGAMNWATVGTIEDFSSRGPTLDNRTKPDIVGADRGDSISYGFGGFSGTSQASPHVAGLAALVRGRYGYSPQDTASYLKENAQQYGGGTPNNVWGYGLAYLPDVNGEPPPPAEAFDEVWRTTDQLVASGGASYGWFWGPTVNEERYEPYEESPGGERQVRYYDKSRMEINDPDAPQGQYYVTNGLLTSELVSGQRQVGDAEFEDREPSGQLVAGDPSGNPGTPSYAAFGPYATVDGETNRSFDRTGQAVTEFLSGNGALSSTDSNGVTLASYHDPTGHNVASVFWDWAQSTSSGLRPDLGVDWLYVLGYPISEPYWIDATVGGVERRVLVQLFQRRALTYTASNSAQYQVEFGNIGQHYLSWIDGTGPPPPPPPPDDVPTEGSVLYETDLDDIPDETTEIGEYFWGGERYHISVIEPGGYYLGTYTTNEYDNFSASLDVYLEEGDGDGCLVVRADPGGVFDYALCVGYLIDDEDGSLFPVVWGMYEGFDDIGYFSEILVSGVTSGFNSFEDGNTLKIIAQGDHLWFFLNGEPIGDAQHSGPATGTVGFTVVNYDDENSEYSFTNLVIRGLVD